MLWTRKGLVGAPSGGLFARAGRGEGASRIRHRSSALLIALALMGALIVGCSENVGCVPGTSSACTCTNGANGAQACQSSRTFGACICGAPLDAGIGSDVPGLPDAPVERDRPLAMDIPPVELTVGPEGGTVRLGDLRVQVPPGAVAAPTAIRVTATNEPAPAGYRAFSPVYRFEPEGTTFAQPVTVTLPFTGDARLATVFWSRPRSEGGGYERLGGVPSGGTVSVTVTHFSTGFVADGVDYTETPDRTCARTRVLDTRYGAATGISSSVAVFFGAEDCLGRPMPDLAATDFTTVEDGTAVSSEGRPTILPAPGLQLFVTLSLDLSSSTQPVLPQVISAARALVDQLAATGVPAQVGIEVFAGDPDPVVWQRATLDLDAVRARLDALSTFVPTDRSSTNLHGAVVRGVTRLEEAETAFERRNAGGAFARGYLVLFTDGADTAGRTTLEDATTAARRARNQVVTVGLRGADFGDAARAALQRLGGSAYVEVVDAAVLEREFRFLAARIAGQARATYVLGYCSPRRSGEHAVGVRVTGATRTAPGDNTDGRFDATGFGPGCAVEAFDRATRCGTAQCGGLGCGACDDRSDTCDATMRRCVNNCVTARRCGGATLTNTLGYIQRCDDQPGAMSCGGTCRDTRNDAANCGACGTRCAATCASGVCVPVVGLVAGGRFTCARLGDGTVRCWGRNDEGELGDGSEQAQAVPTLVPGLAGVRGFYAGNNRTCAVLNDDAVWCWGGERFSRPALAPRLSGVAGIAVGRNHTCAWLTDGTVRCWGDNSLGQIGDGTRVNRGSPTVVSGLSGVVQLVAGLGFTIARRTDGAVLWWGDGLFLGLGGTLWVPTLAAGLSGIAELALGQGYPNVEPMILARTNEGRVFQVDGRTSTQVIMVSGAVGIAAGQGPGSHACARLGDGTVRCWGGNAMGQIGDGTTMDRPTPTLVSGLGGVAEIVVGRAHTCSRLNDGGVRCWGGGGVVGDGTTISRSMPTAVSF
jgi:hypothetical protein